MPSAAQRDAARAATVGLKRQGGMIAGTLGPPEMFGDAVCEPSTARPVAISCSFGTSYYGNMDPTWFEVRLQPNGAVSKVLGRRVPVAGSKSSKQTAALLASDDALQNAPSRTRDYACRRSPRVERDGTRGSTDGIGQLCTTYFRVSRQTVRRYVEFAPDGTALRDYLIR